MLFSIGFGRVIASNSSPGSQRLGLNDITPCCRTSNAEPSNYASPSSSMADGSSLWGAVTAAASHSPEGSNAGTPPRPSKPTGPDLKVLFLLQYSYSGALLHAAWSQVRLECHT